jgi:hypothetical protein
MIRSRVGGKKSFAKKKKVKRGGPRGCWWGLGGAGIIGQ